MTRPRDLIPILALGLCGGLAAVAVAEIIPVSPGGPLTIQAAVDLAVDGDIVELLDGVYTGDGNRDIMYHGKAITVRSQSGDPLTCIIDSEGTEGDPHRAFYFADSEGADAVVEGLTIRGGHHGWSGGILAEVYCTPIVRNCRFIGNRGSEGAGLCTKDAALIEDCWFEDNVSTSHGGGASAACNLGWASTFRRCTFVNNTAGQYGGAFRC